MKLNKPRFFKDVVQATIFIYLSIFLFGFVAVHLGAFDPIHRALEDFDYADLAFKFKAKNQENFTDKEIVVVELAHSRAEIAEEINVLSDYSPSVIGIDAWFTSPRDMHIDSVLLSSFKKVKNMVMGAYLSGEEEGDSFKLEKSFGELGELGSQAFVNFGGEGEKTIRYFLPFKKTEEGKSLSFASAVVKLHNPEKYEEMIARNKEAEYINYTYTGLSDAPGNVDVISFAQLMTTDKGSLSERLNNKIVLIGELNPNSLEDLHFTPYNKALSGRSKPDMPGVFIHANIVHMILKGNYVSKVPAIFMWVLSLIITFLVVTFFAYHFVENHIWYHLYAKILQLVFAVFVIVLEIFLLAKWGLKFETKMILVPVFLSVDLLYFYDAIVKYLHKRYGFRSYFILHHE